MERTRRGFELCGLPGALSDACRLPSGALGIFVLTLPSINTRQALGAGAALCALAVWACLGFSTIYASSGAGGWGAAHLLLSLPPRSPRPTSHSMSRSWLRNAPSSAEPLLASAEMRSLGTHPLFPSFLSQHWSQLVTACWTFC